MLVSNFINNNLPYNYLSADNNVDIIHCSSNNNAFPPHNILMKYTNTLWLSQMTVPQEITFSLRHIIQRPLKGWFKYFGVYCKYSVNAVPKEIEVLFSKDNDMFYSVGVFYLKNKAGIQVFQIGDDPYNQNESSVYGDWSYNYMKIVIKDSYNNKRKCYLNKVYLFDGDNEDDVGDYLKKVDSFLNKKIALLETEELNGLKHRQEQLEQELNKEENDCNEQKTNNVNDSKDNSYICFETEDKCDECNYRCKCCCKRNVGDVKRIANVIKNKYDVVKRNKSSKGNKFRKYNGNKRFNMDNDDSFISTSDYETCDNDDKKYYNRIKNKSNNHIHFNNNNNTNYKHFKYNNDITNNSCNEWNKFHLYLDKLNDDIKSIGIKGNNVVLNGNLNKRVGVLEQKVSHIEHGLTPYNKYNENNKFTSSLYNDDFSQTLYNIIEKKNSLIEYEKYKRNEF
jgi:hypothetical protein